MSRLIVLIALLLAACAPAQTVVVERVITATPQPVKAATAPPIIKSVAEHSPEAVDALLKRQDYALEETARRGADCENDECRFYVRWDGDTLYMISVFVDDGAVRAVGLMTDATADGSYFGELLRRVLLEADVPTDVIDALAQRMLDDEPGPVMMSRGGKDYMYGFEVDYSDGTINILVLIG